MQVLLKHPGTGATKLMGVGWSWSMFLAAGGLMGIPLFFRGLSSWGLAVFVLWTVRLASPALALSALTTDTMDWILTLSLLCLSGYIGFMGSTLSARHYLACGYDFAAPDSVEARIAAQSWGFEFL